MIEGKFNQRRLPWLVGPARDVIFFLAPFVFSVAASIPFQDSLYVAVMFHTLLTFRLCRTSAFPGAGKQATIATVAIAACVFIAVIEWYLNRHSLLKVSSPSIALLYFLNAWHTTSQSLYIVRLYRERAGPADPFDAALDRQLVTVNALFFYAIGWFYLDQIGMLVQWHSAIFPYLFVLLALYGFVLAVIVVQRRVRQFRRDPRTALPITALLAALIYPWPMFLVLWNPEPSLAWLTVPLYAHVAQYLALHFYILPRRGGAGRFALQCGAALAGAVALLIAMKVGGAMYEKTPVASYIVQGIAMGLSVLHTIGDFRLFRTGEQIGPPITAKDGLASSAPLPSQI